MSTKSQQTPSWKQHVGRFAWPTVALAVGSLGLHGAMWWAVGTGRLSVLAAAAVNVVAAYVAFTPMHEASHGNIHGADPRWRWLSEVIGWLCATLFLAPYSAFKVLHLRHHSRTNHPVDPDLWVAGRSVRAVVLRCLSIVPHYYYDFLLGPSSATNAARKQRWTTIGAMVGLFALVGVGVVLGLGPLLFWLWVVPGVIASGLLAFMFDWVPHHPHDVRERGKDTRVVLGPGLELLMLGQNYHLMHHLYPRVPFYAYRRCFEEQREELDAMGAPIVDLRSRR